MRLSEFLRSDLVLSRLEARDIEGVVREVSTLAGSRGVAPEDLIAEKLLARERAHPTVMGHGLAIPHATIPGLAEPVIGVALASEPIPWGEPGSDAVRIIVVVLSPPGREREHVRILARICRLMRHDDFLERLQAADDPEAIVGVVKAMDARHA